MLKSDTIKKQLGKSYLAPFEDVALYLGGIKFLGSKKEFGDYEFQFQLEKYRSNTGGIDERHEKVLGDKGVYVGGGQFFKGKGHFLTLGKTRGGKGTNLIVPQLLSPERFDGSVVALDVKGTLAMICAKYLNEQAGKKVIVIDPWNIQKKKGAQHNIEPSAVNPLAVLNKDEPEFMDDCDLLADMLVSFNQSEFTDKHWIDRAKQWVSYYVMWMVLDFEKEDRTLAKLREMFNYDAEERFALFADMQVYDEISIIKQNGKQLADMFTNAPKEAQSILSTIIRALDIFKSPMMEKATSGSDYLLSDITSGDYYVFIVIPPDRLSTHFRWVRLLIGSITQAIVQNSNKRVLMILDEFPVLEKLDLVR